MSPNPPKPILRGSIVHVTPVDGSDFAQALVLIISGNQRSIAVSLDDRPNWISFNNGCFMTDRGIVMLLVRDHESEPWRDLVNNQPFTITPA